MATNKDRLNVYVSPEVYARLKEKHRKTARRRDSTGNRITFSSWIESILVEYLIAREDLFRKVNIDSIEDEL